MGNVLSEEKRQQVLALGRLGWPLRRIETETGVRRETASAYLKAAGIGEELVRLETCGVEMNVVEQSVADARGVQYRRELRLPDAFGQPRARGAPAKVMFEIGGEASDLFALIVGRNADENGFVEAAANHFNLSTLDQGAELGEIFRAIFFEPLQQRAGIVQRGVNLRMLFEELDERLIGFVVAGFQDAAEIAARLVRVNQQGQMELGWRWGRHGDAALSTIG